MPSSIRIYSYSSCTTCKKALNWLRENHLQYELIDIVQNPPTKEMLSDAFAQLGSRKLLFNTSGISYRKLGSKVVNAMNDDEALEALARDGKLIKRPFLVTKGGAFLIGFKEEAWNQFFLR